MQISCKFGQMAGVHSQLQSQSFSFSLRHLDIFNVPIKKELDKPTCGPRVELKQTAWREWMHSPNLGGI